MEQKDYQEYIETFRKIDSEINTAFSKYFPHFSIRERGNSGPSFSFNLPDHNCHFENTDYFYKDELTFIHFTSINNLFSILNERAFRFYNLHNSEDSNEYKHTGEVLGISDGQLAHHKKYLFTFSCCPSSDIRNDKLWKLYGKEHTGVAIEFKIENDIKLWEKYHIAQVKYEPSDNFKSMLEEFKKIEVKRNIKINVDLSKIIGFHKAPDWADEKEIRIMTYFPYQYLDEYLKFSKTEFKISENGSRFVDYIKLPLWVNNESPFLKGSKPDLNRHQSLSTDFFEKRPKIKINKILIGQKSAIPNNQLIYFIDQLSNLVQENYGYKIEINRMSKPS